MQKFKNTLKKLFILLFYRNDTMLLTAPGKRDRDLFIWQAVLGTGVITLIAGVILSGLYIEVGTPDYLMGYIPNIPSIAGTFLIFAGIIIERLKNRKRFIIILNIICKTFIVGVVWIPFFVPREIAPYVMLPFTFFGFTLNSLMSVAINSWFVDTIDEKLRGRYMGVRQIFALLISATFPVIAGRFLDVAPDRYMAFCIIYSIAWIIMLAESFTFLKISDESHKTAQKLKVKLKDIIIKPLKNKEFMKFLVIQLIFHTSWFLSMSFASVYQIRYMELPYTYLTAMGTVNAVLQMVWYPMWGKAVDKYGSNFVMRIAIVFYTIHAFLQFSMVESTAVVLMLLLNINASILGPAWMLSTFNERFNIIPKEGRTIYDGFFTSFLGLIIFIAPTLGNQARKMILDNNVEIISHSEFRLLFLATGFLLIGLTIYLLIKSKKETNLEKEKQLYQSLFKKKRIKA